jgi:small-conductance mechanosensitive channel
LWRACAVNTGHALSVPNSVLAKASITNEDRIAKRRITPSVVIDANTPAAQIAPLPIALREAARAAMKEAGLEESVSFSNSEKGDGAELLAADKDGLHFVIVINVVLPSNYLTLWKRVHTAAMCGMLGELQKRGIKLGRRRVDMEPAK